MNVQQIELINFSHFGHAGGQSQIVRRKLEQRIL